jgi:assimilatory nitrate reductase catalytic subunit
MVQIHPSVARRYKIAPGDMLTLESRRGRAEFAADVTADIRPDTLFAPFHWGGRSAANRLINAALDPISRMPEFKLAAVRIVRGGGSS